MINNLSEIIEQLKTVNKHSTFRVHTILKDLEIPNGFTVKECAYHILKNGNLTFTKPLCKCGAPLRFINMFDGYDDTCLGNRTKCPYYWKKVIEKREANNLKKYGVKNHVQSSDWQEKQKQKNLEKYGVEYTFQLDSVKEKIKQTNMERYGAESHTQNSDWQETRKQKNLEKYGVESTFQLDSVKEKIKQTNLEKYGCESHNSVDIVKEHKKQSCIKKYGVENPMQLESTKQKLKSTFIERYGVDNPTKNENVKNKIKRTWYNNTYDKFSEFSDKVIPNFSKEEFNGVKISESYSWHCVSCNKDFDAPAGGCPQCPYCKEKYGSKGQLEVYEYITKELGLDAIINDRRKIYPDEIDIYIPSLNIGIEYNGVYWHSKCISTYHVNKTEYAKEVAGIRLIHIYENDWLGKQKQVKERLSFILGDTRVKRIFARNCIVKEISNTESREFLENHHLQGNVNANIKLGLFYEKELVSVMTFSKPRYNKKYQYELIRFASKYRVVGGASKLFKYFVKTYNPTNVLSYCDRTWSEGNLYKQLGFKNIDKSTPSYFYSNGITTITRYQAMKHKLKKLLGDKFDESKTEKENMKACGYYQVYDCGTLVYLWENTTIER